MVNLVKPQEANKILKEKSDAVYIDVRTVQEFEAGHPSGAYNIPILGSGPAGMVPNAEFVTQVEKHFAKDKQIICGCKSGGRSQRAAEMLVHAGYSDVSNMLGGYLGGTDPDGIPVDGWNECGLPTSNTADGRSYDELK